MKLVVELSDFELDVVVAALMSSSMVSEELYLKINDQLNKSRDENTFSESDELMKKNMENEGNPLWSIDS